MAAELRAGFTAYQSKYFAHELARSYANDHVGKLAGLLFDAQVEPKPHQIDAALFALNTPHLPGVLLAGDAIHNPSEAAQRGFSGAISGRIRDFL